MGRSILKGDTIEKKMDNVARLLQATVYSSKNKYITVTPPIPISHFSQVLQANEKFFFYLAPADCTIKRMASYCAKIKGLESISLVVTISNSLGDFNYKIALPFGEVNNYPVDFALPAGSRVSLQITDPPQVENFWLGLLITFDRTCYDYEEQKLIQLKQMFSDDIKELQDLEQVE